MQRRCLPGVQTGLAWWTVSRRRPVRPMEAACPHPGPQRSDAEPDRPRPAEPRAAHPRAPRRVSRIAGAARAPRRTRRRFFAELPFLLVAALILTVLVKGFLIQAFYIPSRSMEPTLDVGDRVVVNRLAYRLGDPAHGQVVVFLRPTGVEQAPGGGPLSWARRAVAQGLGGAPPGSAGLIKRGGGGA